MNPHLLLTIYLCVWLAAAGAVLGSFLDCAVWRWARGEAMFRGRSHCAGCGRTLSPGELVPVFSYLFSRGRCRGCGGKIPAECLWAELAGGLAFVCLGVRFGLTLELAQWLVFGGLLLAVRLDRLAYGRAALLTGAGVAVCAFFARGTFLPVLIASGLAAGLLDDALQLVSDKRLNDRFPSAQRATLVSVSSMTFSLFMIPLSPLFGMFFS